MLNTNACKLVLKEKMRALTPLADTEIDDMLKDVPLKSCKKGEILLHQGDKPSVSYYVIQGCIRQYASDELGKEVTLDFFTEEESINMFSYADEDGYSRYSLSCLEDSVLVICPDCEVDESTEESIEIVQMKDYFFKEQFTRMQKSFMDYKIQKPEQRFEVLMRDRPDLLDRVPQIIMASYLGITPETFSRFKKRMMKT
jgi:CRP-like cAMP-binding protein